MALAIESSPAASIPADELLWEWVRFGWNYRGIGSRSREEQDWYAARVKREMAMILGKELADFFCFTSDVIRWAKDNGVAIGPGRGSTAASAVAYLLRITEIDTYKYPDMIFERFLDVTRHDPPDIDVDCSDEDRHKVWDYIAGKYGAECFGHIANFVKYKAKNSLQDVARVYNIPIGAKEVVSNLVIERSGGDSRADATLEDTFALFPAAQEVLEAWPDLARAARLEGDYRQMSVHACGLVVANSPLTDICAVYERDGERVLSIDKIDAEYTGALKLDFLGLSTMGMIARCLALAGITLEDLYAIPDDDPSTLAIFKRNDLTGIFQFSGRATRLVNRDVGPDHFGHITDINALSRPGPLFSGQTAEYVDVRHGRKSATRMHPIVDEITSHTYGQMIYQEHILRCLKEIGDLEWTNVHHIRRIIAKKAGQAAFQQSFEAFADGAKRLHGMDHELAEQIWMRLVTSGTYAFCCTGETVLEKGGARQGSPQTITVKELHDAYYSKSAWGDKLRYGHHGRRIGLLQMDDDGRIRPAQFVKIHHPRPRRIVKVTTDTGRELRCSREHLIMTPAGYRRADSLRKGSRVIVGLPKEVIRKGPNYHAAGGHWNITDGDRTGMANPGWIDGRAVRLREAQAAVRERSRCKCEHCGATGEGPHELEFAHIMSLEFYKGNYAKYHSPDNILHLCNSCHKKLDYQKGERVRRWTRGRPTGTETVVSVTDDGVDLVYEISMEGPSHNYLANGIVSHNNIAHAVSYSMLAFWTAWLKSHYPVEFYAASLAKTNDAEEQFRLMRDALAHSVDVRPPDRKLSRDTWTPAPNGLVAGWRQVPGCGEKMSERIVTHFPDGFDNWEDLKVVPGIGDKKIETMREFTGARDPFGLYRTERKLNAVRHWLKQQGRNLPATGKEKHHERIPLPTHNGAQVAAIHVDKTEFTPGARRKYRPGPRVTYMGVVRRVEIKDVAEDERSRTGEDMDVILARLWKPELLKRATLHCYDDTDEEVYLRIKRYDFPRFIRKLETVRVNHDVVVCVGERIYGFGTPVKVNELFVIDPD